MSHREMAEVELYLRKTAQQEAEAKSRLQVPAELLVLTRFKDTGSWSVRSDLRFLSRLCWTGPTEPSGCCSTRTSSRATTCRSDLDEGGGAWTDLWMTSSPAAGCRRLSETGWRNQNRTQNPVNLVLTWLNVCPCVCFPEELQHLRFCWTRRASDPPSLQVPDCFLPEKFCSLKQNQNLNRVFSSSALTEHMRTLSLGSGVWDLHPSHCPTSWTRPRGGGGGERVWYVTCF